MREHSSSGLVFATDAGRMCPGCRQPLAACVCARRAADAAIARGDGILRVSREKAGRGGKTVTVIRGAALAPDALAALAKRLKSLCGSGGTAKDGVIEIQGDHADRLVEALGGLGHRVKRAGG